MDASSSSPTLPSLSSKFAPLGIHSTAFKLVSDSELRGATQSTDTQTLPIRSRQGLGADSNNVVDISRPVARVTTMLQSNQPQYPEELSKFLTAQAAQLDAQPIDLNTSPFDAVRNASMYEGVPLMPPEFQLMHPRRVRWSSWVTQPDGSMAHFIGTRDATPEQEIWHRINYPERGLHPDDLLAYRKSQRGPVAKFFAGLKFWPTKVKDEWEIPPFLRKQSD